MISYDLENDSDEDLIAAFSEEPKADLVPISHNIPDQVESQEISSENRQFRIRLANTEERRESASVLVDKMYSWRGYEHSTKHDEKPNRITIITSDNNNQVIGTVTIGLDSRMGLLADEMYHEELEALRREGKRLCEFNRLAINSSIRSKRVLACLIHVAILYPSGVFGCTDGVLEINPRHVQFYEKALGFTRIGAERMCPRVKAPSILLKTNFAYMDEQIKKLGGLMARAKGEKSLYPYFFNYLDAIGILGRLKRVA